MKERTTTVVAASLGVLAALGLVWLIMTFTGGGDDTTITAPSTTTLPPTTVAPTTTAASTTTAAPTTTLAPTTTIAFAGNLDDKNCDVADSVPEAGTITAVRFAQHPGFTRVVFDFDGAVPACFVEQLDPTTIAVTVWAVAGDPPYADGVFDGTGTLAAGTEQVVAVSDAGMGAGSGEWVFHIVTISPDRPFTIQTLVGPSRLAIDIGG